MDSVIKCGTRADLGSLAGHQIECRSEQQRKGDDDNDEDDDDGGVSDASVSETFSHGHLVECA